MRILMISVKSDKSRGGIAVWTKFFLSRCSKHNIETDLVNTEVIGKRLQNATSGRNVYDEFCRTRLIFGQLKRYLKSSSNEYEIAHLNTSCGPYGLIRDYFIARTIVRKNINVVTQFRCDIPFWIKNPISKFFLKKLCEISSERMVLCDNSQNYLKDTFGISSIKMPNFIDDSVVLNNPKSINQSLRKAVFVGRVSNDKGAKELYELAEKFPDITFELVGEVTSLVEGYKKPNNVVLRGSSEHDKVIEYMDGADFFIFPTHSEGFSIALTEAMARGLPSVATDVGANKDMVYPDCGYIVNVGDVDAMETSIKKLYSYEVREKMSNNALTKVKNEYVPDVVIDKLKSVYIKNSKKVR